MSSKGACMRVLAIVLGACVVASCAKASSPTAPGGVTISAIAFSAPNVAAGATLQGTVTLTGAAPSQGVTISLTSSNPAIATVPASVTAASGSTNAEFFVTGVKQGSVTITASFDGTSRQSPSLIVGDA